MLLVNVMRVALAGAIALGGAQAQQPASNSADPNLPKGKGLVMLAPNPLGAKAVAYAYLAGDIPTALTVGFADQPHGMVYLGYNDEGTWMYESNDVYVLKGTTFRRAAVKSLADVPKGLKNPSPQYLADHANAAPGKEVTAAAGKYSDDPNFPSARGEVALRPNPYNIKKLFYQYPNGPKSAPLVQSDGHTVAAFLYLGYNDEGTWFSGGWVLKGDLLSKTPPGFTGNMLPLGVKNPSPEYFQHFPLPQVLYRNLYGDDPNLPASAGNIELAPNPMGAQAVTYFFQMNDPELRPAVEIDFKDSYRNPHYLGHNEQGSWIAYGHDIYLLRGKQLSLADAKSTEQTPKDLKDGSPLYCSAHPGLVCIPHRAPLAFDPKFATTPDGNTSLTYELDTVQPGGSSLRTPLKFKVTRPSPNAVVPAGFVPVVIKPDNVGTWIWIGEGAEAGKAALFYHDVTNILVWILLTPEQAGQYLGRRP